MLIHLIHSIPSRCVPYFFLCSVSLSLLAALAAIRDYGTSQSRSSDLATGVVVHDTDSEGHATDTGEISRIGRSGRQRNKEQGQQTEKVETSRKQ